MKCQNGPVRILISIFLTLLLFDFCLTENDVKAGERCNLKFEISVLSEAHPKPITGRVYVMITQDSTREPRFQVGPTGVPFWGKDIKQLDQDNPAYIDRNVFGYPLENIKEVPPGEYYVQGFVNVYTKFERSDGHTIWMHNDQWEGQRWNRSPKNLYSDVKKVFVDPKSDKTIKLVCNHVIPPIQVPEDTKYVRRIKFKSELLSQFWGQPIYLGATVLLPEGYGDHPDVLYPVNYIQGHFSLRPSYGFRTEKPENQNRWARRGYEFHQFWTSDTCPRMIAVTFQHPCPYYDDSYGVNSANVGPYGDAIMEELIPKVEETFRIIQKPYARILSGGSTGGWIALALQIFHPDFFGGTFSLCPDPVDFRYYQIVNIYEDQNAYFTQYDWLRIERPNRRVPDGNVRSTMRNENLYEWVVGNNSRSGGQWDIWEAVFSPVGPDGYPKRIWNKCTGAINHEVAEHWKQYDLRLYMEEKWSWLGPKLVEKLNIYTGSMDSFYLNNAVVLLEKFLENTKDPYYDGVIEYGERKPHCWGPRSGELIHLISKFIADHAPEQEDTSLWHY